MTGLIDQKSKSLFSLGVMFRELVNISARDIKITCSLILYFSQTSLFALALCPLVEVPLFC